MELVSWLVGIIATVAIGHLIKRYIKFRKYQQIIDRIPGPNYLPIFGHILECLVPFDDLINTFLNIVTTELYAGHSVVRCWVGPSAKVLLLKGSSCEAILKNSKYVEKPPEYNLAKDLLGDGLLISKREKWRKHRKILNPSFHTSVVNEFVPIFNEQSKIYLRLLKKVEDGGPFDIVPYIRNLSLDMLCESIMGVKVNAQENAESEYVKAHNELGELFCMRLFIPFLYPTFVYNLTPYKKREKKYIEIIHSLALKVIRERAQFLEQRELLQKIQNGVGGADENEIFGEKRRPVMLDTLIESTVDGRKLTEAEIMEEVVIHIGAGHETTADSMSFTVYLLGRHLEAQKRVQEELDNVLGDSDRPMTSDDLQQLKYLDAVIKESNRLYPPIPFFGRIIDEDVVVEGYTIPAGTTIGLILWAVHRDPKVFPDPEKFDPERFLGANANGRSIYEYMPFSQGPRNCIGYKMGILETKVSVVQLLRKYDIISHDKPEDLKLVTSPDLRSIHGLKISIQKRKRI